MKVTHDECELECTKFGINALNRNCKSEHKSLETFEESKIVIPLQVQALDCYQNERRQDESQTENHSHSRRRCIRYQWCTDTEILQS